MHENQDKYVNMHENQDKHANMHEHQEHLNIHDYNGYM